MLAARLLIGAVRTPPLMPLTRLEPVRRIPRPRARASGWSRPTLRAILAAASLASACASPPTPRAPHAPGDYTYLKERLAYEIERGLAATDGIGLSIALANNRELIWESAAGYMDRENGVQARPDTIYEIGSITKPMTAVALLQLVEQGRVNLDAPLAAQLPGFSIQPPPYDLYPEAENPRRAITPRDLLTHRAGLPSDNLSRMFSVRPRKPEEYIALTRATRAAYPPGYALVYSNLGFTLAGELVRARSSLNYSDYLERRVFAPCGMHSTHVDLARIDRSRLAVGYARDEPGPTLETGVQGAGAVRSTAADLTRFAQAVLNSGECSGGRILSAASVREMLRRQNGAAPRDFDTSIGLAWFLNAEPESGVYTVGHNGGTVQFVSALLIAPEEKLTVAVLANSAESAGLTGEIATLALRLAVAAKHGRAYAEARPPAEFAERGATPEELQALAGDYQTLLGWIRLSAGADRLTADLDALEAELLPVEGGFRVRLRIFGLVSVNVQALDGLRVSFPEVGGRRYVAVDRDGRRFPVGSRISTGRATAEWRGRLGRYALVDEGEDAPFIRSLSLAEREDALLIELETAGGGVWRLAVAPSQAHRLTVIGVGRQLGGELVFDPSLNRLTWQGLQFQRLPD